MRRPEPRLYNGGMLTSSGPVLAGSAILRAQLDNGLRVLVREVHAVPLVSVWCWYGVGSRDEAPGLTGISHWVEHMNFKGTTHIPAAEMKGIVERFGGMWNGYTWIDQTTYVETAARAALDRMLFIESERMGSSLFEAEACEAERTVIISELQGSENDPEQVLDTEVTATAFHAHPYRHPTIGWLHDLHTITRDDLYDHYRRHYVPGNATLVVVGDVDPEEVLRCADRYFGRIAPGTPPERRPVIEPPQLGERRVALEREGTTSYLKFAYHAPAATEPDFFPLLVLDGVLTGAKGLNLWSSFRVAPPQRRSRLYTALVERGLAAQVHGALLPTADPFLYTLSFTAMTGVSLPVLEEAVRAALAPVSAGEVDEAEVGRAKRQLRARLVFEDDSVTNLAHQLGYCETIAGPDFYPRLQACIASVTVDEVREAARRRLQPTALTVGSFRALDSRP
jgi:zinc protease